MVLDSGPGSTLRGTDRDSVTVAASNEQAKDGGRAPADDALGAATRYPMTLMARCALSTTTEDPAGIFSNSPSSCTGSGDGVVKA